MWDTKQTERRNFECTIARLENSFGGILLLKSTLSHSVDNVQKEDVTNGK